MTMKTRRVTFAGYDRDNDKVWEVEGMGFFQATTSEDARIKAQSQPGADFYWYQSHFGPITPDPK